MTPQLGWDLENECMVETKYSFMSVLIAPGDGKPLQLVNESHYETYGLLWMRAAKPQIEYSVDLIWERKVDHSWRKRGRFLRSGHHLSLLVYRRYNQGLEWAVCLYHCEAMTLSLCQSISTLLVIIILVISSTLDIKPPITSAIRFGKQGDVF